MEELDATRATDTGDDEYRSWAYTVFSRNGELPPADFGALLHARRVRLTERALDILAEHGTWDGGRVEDTGEAFPLGMATVGDELVDAFTWQEIVICVVRGVQAHVAEAREERWPVCPEHGRGLHAGPAQGRGPSLAFVVTGGNTNDCTVHHRDGSDPGTIPERADHVRSRARRGSRGGRPPFFDREVYKHRNVVERCFSRLKQWRGIVTRYDKTAQS